MKSRPTDRAPRVPPPHPASPRLPLMAQAYHAIPYRADFTKALGDPAKVEADMPAVWKTFAAIMTPLDAFLKETKIEPPPSESWW